jgi:hypothetical protein
MKKIMGLIILFAHVTLFAQQNVILSGKIVDFTTRNPIKGVFIRVEQLDKTSISDADGKFKFIQIPTGNYTITFYGLGYKTIYKQITVSDSSRNFLEIEMVETINILSEVTITGKTKEAEEVAVIKNNVMPVTIITAKQIENRTNLNEILARQAGVQIRVSGGLGSSSKISVRGLEGKRVAIFLDGNPLNTPDGSLGINDLPVQIIERIEIYKGAVPAYLGGDGLGSAVNIVFRHRDVSYIDASVSRQSFNTHQV